MHGQLGGAYDCANENFGDSVVVDGRVRRLRRDATGNFCSACGADLRQSALGFLGQAAAPVRRSFPVVYLKLLRAPVRQTVTLAEDPSYRGHISFALAGIALYYFCSCPS